MLTDEINVNATLLHSLKQGTDSYNTVANKLHHLLAQYGLIGQLSQLVRLGPVWDGDIVSKSERDDLIDIGLATRVSVKGEQGYTAANYTGWDVLSAI